MYIESWSINYFMRIVYTTGVFDIFHPGHLNLLLKASKMGDCLVIGVQDDESVLKQKDRLPVMTCTERVSLLQSLPFVDRVISYSGTDQREILAELKPSVMVQGDDWLQTSDRSILVDFLKTHNILLHLIPYTKGISSSEIKARVLERFATSRNDVASLQSSLRIIPINELRKYERNDPVRTSQLVEKIKLDKCFIDPITVGKYKNTCLVIDGANRLEALHQSGIKNILANVVSYTDKNEVHLCNNAHYLSIPEDLFINLLKKSKIEYTESTLHDGIKKLIDGRVAATIETRDNCYVIQSSATLKESASVLNELVGLYLGKFKVKRLSELSENEENANIKITFQAFTVDQIIDLVNNSMFLHSGITWHKIKTNIIRVNLPIQMLEDKGDIDSINKKLKYFIDQKVSDGLIRYYPTSMYVCDDW